MRPTNVIGFCVVAVLALLTINFMINKQPEAAVGTAIVMLVGLGLTLITL